MSNANEWPTVKLSEISSLDFGAPFKSSQFNSEGKGLPVVRIRDVERGFSETFYLGDFNPRHLVDDGDFLIGMDGKFSIAEWQGGQALLNQRVCRVAKVTPDHVFPRYLLHFLPKALFEIEQKKSFVTVKHLSAKDLRNLEVPLPPLAEQQRIAEILDASSSVITSRKKQMEELSALDNSLFERFHLAHLEQATQYHLQDVVPRIDSGKSPVCESRPASADEWGVLKLSAVTTGEFRQEENKAYLGDAEPLSHLEIQSGDLLMTRKNTPELVGAVSLVRETTPNLLLPDLIFRLNVDRDLVEPEYLAALLMSPPVRFAVRSLAGGSAKSMSNISKQRLNRLLLNLPPLEIQRKFVSATQEIQSLKKQVLQAQELSEELLSSLNLRTFQGMT